MKVICSHDVDHLFIYEHWKDKFIPGLMLRTFADFKSGIIDQKGAYKRFRYRTNRINELVTFNQKNNVPANFFFGMRNALSLSYSSTVAAPIIKDLSDNGAFIGLHGISYDSFAKLNEEKTKLDDILGYKSIGVRNHYLRQNSSTKDLMHNCGFLFDSTDCEPASSHTLDNGMIEFPISIMDVDVIKPKKKLEEILKETFDIVEMAIQSGQDFFVINFHDIYFEKEAYPLHFLWYVRLIEYLAAKGLQFISFQDAVGKIKN